MVAFSRSIAYVRILELQLLSLYHHDGRISNSDWFVNSFIMVVYEKFF